MKFKSIRVKMLAFIIPAIMITMGVLTFISATNSKSIIDREIKGRMSQALNANIYQIESYLTNVETTKYYYGSFYWCFYRSWNLCYLELQNIS